MGVEISTLHVRRSSLANAAPARVWHEFASFERFDAWPVRTLLTPRLAALAPIGSGASAGRRRRARLIARVVARWRVLSTHIDH